MQWCIAYIHGVYLNWQANHTCLSIEFTAVLLFVCMYMYVDTRQERCTMPKLMGVCVESVYSYLVRGNLP